MDPHRLEQWVTTHKELEPPVPERLEEGATFGQVLRLAGKDFKVSWTVGECEQPRRVAWTGEGPAGSKARVLYTLDPLEDGRTRFGYENEFELPGGFLGRAAARAVGDRVSRREAARSLANLAELLER